MNFSYNVNNYDKEGILGVNIGDKRDDNDSNDDKDGG